MVQNRNQVGTSTNSVMSSSPFLKGLNTELSGIVDSIEYTQDELNMLIRPDGTRSRRPGVDYEELFKFNNELIDNTVENLAFNSIEWYDINSPDETQKYDQTPYIVVQIGSKIIFYRNHGQPYSQEQAEFVLDLLNYKISGRTDEQVATARCKFVVAYGCLFITSEAIKPIRLRSAQEDPVVPTVITYPYCTVSCAALQGKHQRMGSVVNKSPAYCKIYFDNTIVMDYEIPADGPDPEFHYHRFPNSYTIAQQFNALSAATRRNITAVPQMNSEFIPDTTAWQWGPADSITFNGSTNIVRGTVIQIKVGGWCYYSGGWRWYENSYKATMAGGSSNYTQSTGLTLMIRDTDVGARDFLSIEENPSKLSYAHLYNLLNQGWTADLIGKFYVKSSTDPLKRVFPGNNLAQQYLKDKTTDAFKPEALINTTFGNTPAARGHFRLDYFEQDRNSISALTQAMQEVASSISSETSTTVPVDDILDLNFPIAPRDPAQQVPVVLPRRDFVADMEHYAGRIFYLSGSTLLYSQMISEDIERADRCYTDADPTSEEISDVIETDGGLISLPDLGEGIKLAQVGSYLLAFGTRSNIAITGTANNIFTATAYSAGALNAMPTQAPYSFVQTEYGLFYWGTTGITFVGPGDGGLQVRDLTSARILTWFGKLTNTQQAWCKGVYSSSKKKIYWFYPSDDTKPRRLDCVLVYDIQRDAFVPSKIATGYYEDDEYIESNLPEIVSGLSLKVPYRSDKEYPISTIPETDEEDSLEVLDDEGVKVLADDPIDSEEFTYESSILVCFDVVNGKITFGDFRNNLIRDWTAGDWNGNGYVFDSYLISHPMNAAGYSAFTSSRQSDVVHTKNMPYLITYFRRTETGKTVEDEYLYPSKCHGSVLWDWRTSGRYGKWSSPVELYRPRKTTIFDEGFIINKTNIRGLGRAFQIKLESVDDAQFIVESLVYDLKNDGRI